MGVLNFLAGLAAIILALELLVVTLLAAAVCGGIWYGLRIAQRKSPPLLARANGYIDKARAYERTGLRLLVKPVILANAYGVSAGTAILTLIERARAGRPSA